MTNEGGHPYALPDHCAVGGGRLATAPFREVATVPAVLMRGGTSKGVFLHVQDVPPAGADRDEMLLELMGSPDRMQIDGLGGTHSSTSKVMIVGPGNEPDIDVSYWFAQVGIDQPVVDWSGNCGNLTTAIAPFAIDEGIAAGTEPITTLRLRNENTGVHVEATLHVTGGRAATQGDLFIAGVPNPGAPIETRYLNPASSRNGTTRVLPTDASIDFIDTPDDRCLPVSIVNVTHPYVFVRAIDLGIPILGAEPAQLNHDAALLTRLERIRAACSVLLGAAATPEAATQHAPANPRLVLVDSPALSGAPETEPNLIALGLSMGKIHHALPITGALCLAAAAKIPATIPNSVQATPPDVERICIRHPRGDITVLADVHVDSGSIDIRSVGVIRSARRLMEGTAFLRCPAPLVQS